MLPLGFRFEVDAVILEETAHTVACRLLPSSAIRLAAGETHWAQRCPRECGCAPPFEPLLSYNVDPGGRRSGSSGNTTPSGPPMGGR